MLRSISISSGQARLHSKSASGPLKCPTFLRREGRHSEAAQVLKYSVWCSFFPNSHTTQDNHKFLVKGTSGRPLEPSRSKSIWDSAKNVINAFYRFSRPHTVKGTILGVLSMSLLAIENVFDFSPRFIMGVLKAMVVALCMNMYIVGINQLTDIEIDKVNKPTLPLASGEFSFETGALIVASCTLTGIFVAWTTGSVPLLWGVFISFLIGTGYSVKLPLLRWKNSDFLAALSIVVYRAVTVQVAYHLHVQTHIFQRPLVLSRSLMFVTAFMSLFAVVIALLKDVPDLEGDKTYGVQTFTVRLGQERVFWFCVSLLEAAYGAAICVGAMSLSPFAKIVTVLGHAIFGALLWNRAKATDLKSNTAFTAFYMFVWEVINPPLILFLFIDSKAH
uniref:Uncharacterized protein n=1 Tax=Kalanchoe fedtschenkoi TaxID=63787 RepID=A0A7N0TGJ3_KALFE